MFRILVRRSWFVTLLARAGVHTEAARVGTDTTSYVHIVLFP